MAWAVSGSWQRVGALASSLVAAAAVAAQAGAQPSVPERAWLSWQGPLECQNTREVERQIESLLGRAPDPAQLPPTHVELGWARERGWTLSISVSLPEGPRRRAVDVRTCADGFDVVALTLALILDPDLELGDDAESPAAALPTNPEATAVALVTGSEAALPIVRSEAPGDGAPASGEAALASSPPEPPHALAPQLALGASGRADFGSLPTSLFGGALELSFSARQWRIDAGAAYVGKAGDTLPTARYPVSYWNLLGLTRGCRQFGGERGGHFGLCLGGQLGSIGASELGGERRSAHGLWAAGSLGAELGLDLTDTWGAFSRVELVFPMVHHELDLADGSVVYELPTVSLQLAIGAQMKLTEWASR